MVLSTSDDGWTAGTPLDVLTDPDRQALLAIGMNGEPLPIEHGFPVRMVVPGLYGYRVGDQVGARAQGHHLRRGRGLLDPAGLVGTRPDQDRLPDRRARRGGPPTPGRVVVAGVAWAQHTGISAVEVQIDEEPWQPAQLAETVGPDTWRQWQFDWAATSGMHTITVRATDADGQLQTADVAPPAPDGATGYPPDCRSRSAEPRESGPSTGRFVHRAHRGGPGAAGRRGPGRAGARVGRQAGRGGLRDRRRDRSRTARLLPRRGVRGGRRRGQRPDLGRGRSGGQRPAAAGRPRTRPAARVRPRSRSFPPRPTRTTSPPGSSGAISTFGMEFVPRISRAQSMDALSSQSLVTGYRGAIVAAGRLRQFFPLSMTAAGTVPPAQVVVLGAGVAGPAGHRHLPPAGRGGQGLRRTRRRGRGDPLHGRHRHRSRPAHAWRAPAGTPGR